MDRITFSAPAELAEEIDARTGEDGEFDSQSEAVRELVRAGLEAEEMEQEIETLENRLDDLRRQMVARDDIEEKVDVLATQMEEQQRQADAPFFVRWVRWGRRLTS